MCAIPLTHPFQQKKKMLPEPIDFQCVHTILNNDDEESLHPEVTPHINATYLHSNGSFKFPAFPDTGGCLTMISLDLASKKKIHVVTNFNQGLTIL